MKKTSISDGRILIYRDKANNIQVNTVLVDKDVWTNMAQFAELFQVTRPTVSEHISNIFKTGELNEEVVCRIFLQTTPHGAIPGKTQTTEVKFYNLKMAIALGFRINSVIATQFRIWANNQLHPVVVNEHNAINAAAGLVPDYFRLMTDVIDGIEIMELDIIKQLYTLFYTSRDIEAYDDPRATIFERIRLRLKNSDIPTREALLKLHLDFARDCAARSYILYMKNWMELLQCILEMPATMELIEHTKLVCESLLERKAEEYRVADSLSAAPDNDNLTDLMADVRKEPIDVINEFLRSQK